MSIKTIQLLKYKASVWLTGTMFLLFTGVFVTAQAQVQVTVNENGGFEDSEVTVGDDTTGVEAWTFELLNDAEANFFVTDQEPHSGERALGVAVNALGGSAWNIQAINEPIEVIPGQAYTFSVWLKATSANLPVDITAGNPDFSEFGRSSVEAGTEWSEFTFQFTVPSGDTISRAPIHFNFNENVGDTIWVDDLSISYPKEIGEPLVVEAESGIIGNEWATETDDEDGSIYVTITTDHSETTGTANYPGENRTISYEITFPDTGSYDLFARVYVGAETFDDDSWFIPQGFGEKHPDSISHWLMSNGLAEGGFDMPDDVVREAGGLGSGMWKWMNFSKNGYQSAPADTFVISDPDSLSRIFQIGAREDGLRIDKIAFGLSSFYYTVDNLDNGEAGSATEPGDDPLEMDPIAEGKEKWLGNIYSPSQVEDFTNYWNQVTPENAGKWGSVEGIRDQMNWGELDAAYDLAKDNGNPFRFHVLVWGGQQPGWINDLNETEQLEEIEEWFDAVAERYLDIDYLEVVNEGSNGHQLPDGQSGDADYIDALGGTGETGHDWIITAFQMARDKFPADVKLMINDYGIVGSASATSNYLDIIEDLQERDLIDVIGVQSHAFSTRGSASGMKSNLDALGETGLPIQATEMDIDGNPNGTDAESDNAQLEEYQRVFPVFWEHPSVEGVTLWGWRPGLWRNAEEAFLIKNDGEERPALEWLRAYVDTADVAVSNEELATTLPGKFELYHNYPNPFNPTTQIKYDVPQASEVSIKVYDVTGRLIQTLVNTRQNAGSHIVQFSASQFSSGVYFYRIEAGSFTNVKRMMLIK